MTDSFSAYRAHDFIRISIDLLAVGAAWRGGTFLSSTTPVPLGISSMIDEARLKDVATRMLLKGSALVKVTIPTGGSPALEFPPEQGTTDPSTIEIERVESSFDPARIPILHHALPSIELYEKALAQSQVNPSAMEVVRYALPPIYSALAISPAMIDQQRISQTPPEILMAGAIQFKAEVNMIRHNLRFGLDQVAHILGQAVGESDLEWDWNEEWLPTGVCKYGHVYQVFQSQGLQLEPIRASELGGVRLAVTSGLLSRATLANCETSYGA